MLGLGYFQWISGLWAPPSVLKRMVDVNGTALSVGQAVKILGTITVLNPGDTHFGSVQVLTTNPGGVTSPGNGLVISVDPSNLVVGS